MTRNEMKKKLAEMVIKAKTVEALELVQKKMEMLGFTDLVFDEEDNEAVEADTPWGKEGVSRGTYYRRKAESENPEKKVERLLKQKMYRDGKSVADGSMYCSEDVSNIEGYELAKSDDFVGWDIHHRLEIDENKTAEQLKSEGLYYNRPATELVFMRHEEHIALHRKHNTEENTEETTEENTEETTEENIEEKVEETTPKKAEAPQRVIKRAEDENVEDEKGDVVKFGAIVDEPIKGQYWLNPDGGELTWDDIIHRMVFDTEDDARSACYQVGKNYLDYVWIQHPETKQFFTGGELAKK